MFVYSRRVARVLLVHGVYTSAALTVLLAYIFVLTVLYGMFST
jgi:hypothetical protein